MPGSADISWFNGGTAAARTIAVNFYGVSGGVQVSTANWNNLPSATGGVTGSNLKYLDDGTNSGISINLPTGLSSDWADNGIICASPTDGFPPEAHYNTLYNATTPITITLSGCNNSKTYRINWLGSRSTATHNLKVANGAQSSTWEAGNPNCSLFGDLTGLVPSSGTITFTLEYTTGSFSYSNACYIIET